MSKSLLELAKSIEQRAKELDEKASKKAVKVAITIIFQLVYDTPVDSSQALSNWQVGLNNPVDVPVFPYFPGFFGSTQRASAQATIAEAKKILKGKKPGQVIFLSNVLPYIGRLNDGHSGQTPPGFVERAVMIGRKQASKAKV